MNDSLKKETWEGQTLHFAVCRKNDFLGPRTSQGGLGEKIRAPCNLVVLESGVALLWGSRSVLFMPQRQEFQPPILPGCPTALLLYTVLCPAPESPTFNL